MENENGREHGPDATGAAAESTGTAGTAATPASTAGDGSPQATGAAPASTAGSGSPRARESEPARSRKRKRGRPRAAKPAAESGAASASAERPKTKSLAVKGVDPATVAKNIAFAHSIAALRLGLPALALSDAEARKLADAVLELIALYDIQLSARMVAWLQLAGVGAAVYGPRAVAIVASRGARAGRGDRASPAPTSAAEAGAPKMDFSADVPGGTRH